MRTKLTTTGIERAKQRSRPYEVHDSGQPGLLLRVQPSGVKSFIVQWDRGKRVTLKPRFPSLTLDAARERTVQALDEANKKGAPSIWRPKARKGGSTDESGPIRTLRDFLDKRYAASIAGKRAHKATLANIKTQFKDLLDKPLASITVWDIDKFKSERLKAGKAPATINRDLDRIRAALNKAIAMGYLASNPVPKVERLKVDNNRVRYLSGDEEKRLRKMLLDRERERRKQRVRANARLKERKQELRRAWSAKEFVDHLQPLVLVAMNTGLRRGELLGLMWDQVDLARKQLTVAAHTAKSGTSRHISLNAEALDVLMRWKEQGSGSGLVFAGASGERMTHNKSAWGGIVEAAGLKDFHFHDLRHHFASRLVLAGVDLYTVKELLGHQDFKMTQRYAHLTPEHNLAAVEKLVARKR